MSDVSCKILITHFDYMKSLGLEPDEFFDRVQKRHPNDPYLRREVLLNPRIRIPWDSFVDLAQEMEKVFTTEELAAGYIDYSVSGRPTWFPFLKTTASLVSSPRQMYRINNILLGPGAFGSGVVPSMEVLPDSRLRIDLKLKEGYRDCPFFFRMSKYGIAKLPKIAGMAEAFVEADIRPGHAIYLVTPPPSRTLWARLARSLKVFFSAPSLFAELSTQDRQMRESYDRLVKSEAELRVVRHELETRVQTRTEELEVANDRLKGQISDILKKEEENRQLLERLVHLQKLEAVGTLAGGISHEINNVLHGIFLSLDSADRRVPADHPAKEKILTAKKFAARGQGLMKQVLAFSRKAHTERQPIDPVMAVREAVQLMRSTLPKHVDIVEDYSRLDHSHLRVLGDLTQIHQVVINLCSNAAHAMRERGGTLRVSLDMEPAEDGQSLISLLVTDMGEGMTPEIRDRIFEPFFTTKPVGEGTGMGLSVVHGIVRTHGGLIQVTTEPGKGSTFKVILPAVSAHEDELIEPGSLDAIGGNEHIMIVDDEVEIVPLLQDTLMAFGYRVTSSTDPLQALELFKRHGADIDLVVTDHSMPKMTGIQLANRLREIKPGIPVILCTGANIVNELERPEAKAITAHVTKPIDAVLLNQAIREALPAKESASAKA